MFAYNWAKSRGSLGGKITSLFSAAISNKPFLLEVSF